MKLYFILFFIFLSYQVFSQDTLRFFFNLKDYKGFAVSKALIKYSIWESDKPNAKKLVDKRGNTDNDGLLRDYVIVQPSYFWSEAFIKYELQFQDYCKVNASKTMLKQKSNQNEIYAININLLKAPILIHKTTIEIRDLKDNPIPNALIKIDAELINNKKYSSKLYTDKQGNTNIYFQYDSIFTCDITERSKLITKVKMEVFADNYYSITDDIYITINSSSEKYNLLSPDDYFEPSFFKEKKYESIITKIKSNLDWIRLESNYKNCNLSLASIQIIEFKSKKYIMLRYSDANLYNTARLSKYNIGQTIFDEAIRKLLNPLNNHLNSLKGIDGYLVVFDAMIRDFTTKDKSEKINYQFYFNKQDVRNYKNNDISGQQLIDKTIILLDGERIDLKLQ